MTEVAQVDDLEVEVRRSSRRRTVDLTVDRFGKLVIAVPEALGQGEIEDIIHRKQLWIYQTLGRKKEVMHPQAAKEYVTGEGFFYLGKKYRLKLFDPSAAQDNTPTLRLRNGRFMLRRDKATEGRKHFIAWYAKRGRERLVEEVSLLRGRVGSSPGRVTVRDLGYKWGSCSPSGNVNFHWRIMLLPPSGIRYLILHELVHLHEPHHGPRFYERVQQVAPDYREQEAWLTKNGGLYQL